MVLGIRVAVEEPPDEGDERDALQLGPPLGVRHVLGGANHRFEPVRVPQRLRGQRRNDLTEPHVAVRERVRVALGAQEHRPDHRAAPADGHDDDGAHVPEVEVLLDARQRRVVRRIGDEHRLPGVERALELGIAVEVDDEVPDARIFVTGDEPDFLVLSGEEDGAAVQPEGLAELARYGLEDVDEVQGSGDLLQDVDDCDQVVALTLKLGYPGFQPGGLPRLGLVRLAR